MTQTQTGNARHGDSLLLTTEPKSQRIFFKLLSLVQNCSKLWLKTDFSKPESTGFSSLTFSQRFISLAGLEGFQRHKSRNTCCESTTAMTTLESSAPPLTSSSSSLLLLSMPTKISTFFVASSSLKRIGHLLWSVLGEDTCLIPSILSFGRPVAPPSHFCQVFDQLLPFHQSIAFQQFTTFFRVKL